ncbi:MAG: RHS repeat-associated core domain-containing protein, partial [Luteolibacter sp.]
LIVCHGDYAKKNPFTYSTKFTEYSTGLCYYGYRWYTPKLGRWISKDPIEESGGINLYAFVGNKGVNKWDYLGQRTVSEWISDLIDSLDTPIGDGGAHGGGWAGALYDLEDWLKGNTPSTTDYPSGDPKSDAMSKSPIGRKLVNGYLDKFKNKTCVNWGDYTNVTLDFGANEFIESIPNGRAHFVGSARGDAYSYQFYPNKCKVKAKFVVTNTTSLKSALYHLIPNSWNRTTPGKSGANWTQTYTWFEEFNCKNKL